MLIKHGAMDHRTVADIGHGDVLEGTLRQLRQQRQKRQRTDRQRQCQPIRVAERLDPTRELPERQANRQGDHPKPAQPHSDPESQPKERVRWPEHGRHRKREPQQRHQ
jgi:hypothetical protein